MTQKHEIKTTGVSFSLVSAAHVRGHEMISVVSKLAENTKHELIAGWEGHVNLYLIYITNIMHIMYKM